MLSGCLWIGDTTSFVTRTIGNTVNFALLINPEDDDSGGTAECLFALLGTCLSGPVRYITISDRKLNPEGVIVEGCAEVDFPHPMLPVGDSPISAVDSIKCGGSHFLFASRRPY
mgnify:FL=1